jgi:hypothetical protein
VIEWQSVGHYKSQEHVRLSLVVASTGLEVDLRLRCDELTVSSAMTHPQRHSPKRSYAASSMAEELSVCRIDARLAGIL